MTDAKQGHALVAHLLEMAARARRAVAEDRISALHQLRSELVTESESATGGSLQLYDVAIGYVGSFIPRDSVFGELDLLKAADETAQFRERILPRLLRSGTADVGWVERQLRGSSVRLEALVDNGVLRFVDDTRVELAPRLQRTALEIVAPRVLRHWSRVEEARAITAASTSDYNSQVQLFAGTLGVSVSQSKQHLKTHPLNSRTVARGVVVERPVWHSDAFQPVESDIRQEEQLMKAQGNIRLPKPGRQYEVLERPPGVGPAPAAPSRVAS